MAFDLVAVDLSHWNTVTSFAEAKAAGLIGVIHKCTQGTSYLDTDYSKRRNAAISAGLRWSSYHFLEYGNASEQMEWYLSKAQAVDGERVCIDFEENPNGPDPTLDDLTYAVTVLQRHTPSLQVTVYGGSYLKQLIGSSNNTVLAATSLWIAQYRSSDPEWPTGTWPTWTLHQYSDGEAGGSPKAIAGIAKPHDCNRFNGSRENCAKWFGPVSQPEPQPQTPVEVAIQTHGHPVTVTVDGKSYVSVNEN